MSKDISVCYPDLQEYGFGFKKTNMRFCLYRGSVSITKPIFKIQPHLALQQDILSKSAFLRIDACAHYLKNGTFGTVVAIMGTEL